MDAMGSEDRRLRADAERNRRRLLDAAESMFCERGLDVGVGEIAERAGVGRGTLFRNFPSKEHLIAAIVVERMNDAIVSGRKLLTAADPGEALFQFLQEIAGRQQMDRALFEAVADTFLANPDISAAYTELVGVLEELVAHAQEAGAVRADVGALDIMMLIKGLCEAASAFQGLDSEVAERQFDLVRTALSATPSAQPLRGRSATLSDLQRAFRRPADTDEPATRPERAAQGG
jgi:AcrR family transcriptional regulator